MRVTTALRTAHNVGEQAKNKRLGSCATQTPIRIARGTGFYKIARCAELAEARAKERGGAPYDYLLVVRPDVLYYAPFELPATNCFKRPDLPKGSTSWISYHQEVLLTPWANVNSIKALEECACCDVTARKPKGCFHMGLGAPWIQFLYRQHFTRRKLVWLQSGAQAAKAKCTARWGHAILRPSHERSGIDWGNLTSQHGVFRKHVTQRSKPTALPLEKLLSASRRTTSTGHKD